MSDRRPASFSAAQVLVAWLLGLLLGGGALGSVAFYSKEWGGLFVIPCVIGGLFTIVLGTTYIISHWDDHN